jgi:hypothetical protein
VAGLPTDGTWLVQQTDGQVVISNRHTDEEVARFDPSDANASAKAQLAIHQTELLDPEQKCFAHFWAGYFYAHAAYSSLAAAEFTVILTPEK